MDAIQPTKAVDGTTAVQPTVTTSDPKTDATKSQVTTDQAATDDFAAYLQRSLGKSDQGEVNEEELFASIISQRLNKESPDAASFYDQKVKELSGTMARADGYVPVEDVAREALRQTAAAEKITTEKAEMINGEAFQAAQLDDNTLCLYDGRGDTAAAASMAEAMFKVKSVIDQLDAGTITATPMKLDTPSNVGSTPGSLIMQGIAPGSEEAAAKLAEMGVTDASGAEAASEAGGSEKQTRFTWKHEASDGNLAILLPTRLNGQIAGVSLFDSDGNLIEKGHYSKQTGDSRAVYRFDNPGNDYGNDIDAVVYLKNDQTLTYHVDDGGKRTYVPQDDFKKASADDLEKEMDAKHTVTASSDSAGSGSSDTASTDSGSGAVTA